MFKLTKIDIGGTHKVGEIFVSPADLQTVMGAFSDEGFGDGKVNGAYHFESETGEIFTVYGYKMPLSHWENPFPAWLSVGGNTDPTAFIHWLTSKVKEEMNQ